MKYKYTFEYRKDFRIVIPNLFEMMASGFLSTTEYSWTSILKFQFWGKPEKEAIWR